MSDRISNVVAQYGVKRILVTTSLIIGANAEEHINLSVLNDNIKDWNFISAIPLADGGSYSNVDSLKVVGVINSWSSVHLRLQNIDTTASHTYSNLTIIVYIHA